MIIYNLFRKSEHYIFTISQKIFKLFFLKKKKVEVVLLFFY